MTMRLSRIADSRAMIAGAVLGVTFAIALQAQAAGSGMPWEEPLPQALESVQGPVAKIVAVIIIIVTGLTLASGATAGGFRRLIQILFALSFAFAALSEELSVGKRGGST